jgi:hypothetical protein
MKRFCGRLLLFASPLLLWFAAYVVLDPFQVIRPLRHDGSPTRVVRNKSSYSTSVYLDQLGARPHDSFIFGNSRTLAFRAADWEQHLPAGSNILLFDGHGESLYGMHAKVELIHRNGGPLRNALVLICPGKTFKPMKDADTHLHIAHPAVSGLGRFRYHRVFLQAWGADQFFIKYLDMILFGTYRSYMEGAIRNREEVDFDPRTAERIMPIEAEIAADPNGYYARNDSIFRRTDSTSTRYAPRSIGPEHEAALRRMRSIFDEHGTDHHIVISPLYDQLALDRTDLALLKEVFGRERVHDHSGVNAITLDRRNYLEASHYRSHVGRMIMQAIYSPGPRNP